MLLNSHISAYTRCLAEKVCGLVRSTWGTSQGEDKLGAREKILNTKVARRACAGHAMGKHSPCTPQLKARPPLWLPLWLLCKTREFFLLIFCFHEQPLIQLNLTWPPNQLLPMPCQPCIAGLLVG